MEFNDIWTKEINDQYRKMVREHKSMDEIREFFGDKMKYHPKQKFKHGGFLTYEKFLALMNEITFYSNYIDFGFRSFKSPRFSQGNDIRCYFTINDIDYVLSLDYLIEDNDLFHNEVVYNVFFTTKEQFDNYQNILSKLKPKNYEKEFSKLQDIVEKETKLGDTIKIFNSLSYILLKMVDDLDNPIYVISAANPKKIKFYKKSIEDSFKDKYELLIGESKFFPGVNTYYYIIKNQE